MTELTAIHSWRDLVRGSSYVNGQFVAGTKHFDVRDPATGAHVAEVVDSDAAETERAITAAADAFVRWRATSIDERVGFLRRWHTEIMAHQNALAELLTREQGKPLAEARSEIAYAASFVEWFAEEGRRAYGETLPANKPGQEYLVVQEPVGVAAAITPWNFPSAMITRKLAPAIAAGCSTVVKPDAETPLSALALAVLAERAGSPAGLINIVVGTDAAAIGDVLCADDRVRKLSFTGSTRVGKLLAEKCAATLKRLSLELGGNAPFIVFEDANLDRAASALITSKFRNSGQTCVCANRIFVHRGVMDDFCDKVLAKMASELRLGHGLSATTTQGPLINEGAVQKVAALVEDACAKGARLELGGAVSRPGALFFEPTLISGVTDAMKIAHAEIFGPVVAVRTFDSEHEALAHANGTPYGLASYVFTESLGRAWRMVRGIESGMVAVNEGVMSSPATPFGGVKHSGYGREGAHQGLAEYLEPKSVCFGGLE